MLSRPQNWPSLLNHPVYHSQLKFLNNDIIVIYVVSSLYSAGKHAALGHSIALQVVSHVSNFRKKFHPEFPFNTPVTTSSIEAKPRFYTSHKNDNETGPKHVGTFVHC